LLSHIRQASLLLVQSSYQRLAVEGYGMYGHFADIKMAMALGLHKALQSYDPALGVPFMIYKNRFLKSEVHNYIRTMRTDYSVPTAAKYAVFRKAMALYNEFENKSDEATLKRIAREIRHSTAFYRHIRHGSSLSCCNSIHRPLWLR
jgi:DNA-directed RNA polymerase specialized sigma subunit